jgi:hypothetical protein
MSLVSYPFDAVNQFPRPLGNEVWATSAPANAVQRKRKILETLEYSA